ncbi:MAG: FadR family transcriptional regulator [Caldilineaceae bacterium]|nr:FadR family transcriptional regulator [Caldilineaceae bacterium]
MTTVDDEPFLNPLPRESLADQVYQVIVRYILRNGVEVGDRLPSERKFSELLEVSRTVVRGALAQLEAEGTIQRQVGVGMILTTRPERIPPVGEINELNVTLEEMYQARIALEVGAIEWVVLGLSEGDLQALDSLVDRMAQRVTEGHAVLKEDREFHLRLIQATHNPVIIKFATLINQYFDRMRIFSPEVAIGRRLDMLEVQHRMIVLALRARDAEAARQALRLHFSPLSPI